MLCWDGKTAPNSPEETLKTVYGEGLFAYHIASTLHSHFGHRTAILKTLGLEWRVFEQRKKGEQAYELKLAHQTMARVVLAPNSIQWLRLFVVENWGWVRRMAELIRPRRLPVPEYRFAGAPTVCDQCQQAFADYMYDAAIRTGRTGCGCVCHRCFVLGGGSLGKGRGQEYSRTADGEWMLNAGWADEA
jgi:hypothetical protein